MAPSSTKIRSDFSAASCISELQSRVGPIVIDRIIVLTFPHLEKGLLLFLCDLYVQLINDFLITEFTRNLAALFWENLLIYKFHKIYVIVATY